MSVNGISQVILCVRNLEVSRHFYRSLLGLVRDSDAPDLEMGWCWFWLGVPRTQRLGLRTASLPFTEDPPRPPFGPSHFALSVPVDSIERILGNLARAGVQVHGPVKIDWTDAQTFFFRDPDQNLVQLWCWGL
jgi:catechol 2,3-dioxygenase-like lactoylglutathione lyase family enzyme